MTRRQESNCRLVGGQYLGEVSALYFLHLPSTFSSFPLLLAGTGSQLLLYNVEEERMVESFQVFDGIRVHGIVIDCIRESSRTSFTFDVAVFGEKRVKLFNLTIEAASVSHNDLQLLVDLRLANSLPRFCSWVLDVSFLKCDNLSSRFLAIGFSDNSVRIWDTSQSCAIFEVQSPDRCLLYSMRLSGDTLDTLRIASGTIYNEIIVWRLVSQHCAEPLTSPLDNGMCFSGPFSNSYNYFQVSHISRLIGHEGSIFRITWSSDASKLVSVSDDRSARIWSINTNHEDLGEHEQAADHVLYGHDARVWDCCISNSLILTASEDCTCRAWGLDGKQLKVIKEHIGRGIWRCLYDPNSSLLVTAGFDSAIKLHKVPASLPWSLREKDEGKLLNDRLKIHTAQIPKFSEHLGLMDSKSEYVRCLRFRCEDTLYVSTNHGYLYHAKFSPTQDVKWTKLVQVSEEVPIICMDLLSKNLPKHSSRLDDWVALGDGKGNLMVVRVKGDICTPEVDFTFAWSAGKERQLFIFTADPRGNLNLWRLCDPELPVSHISATTFNVSHIAEFTSCFGIRIMCLEALFEDEILICGDLRGNLVLFPLPKDLLLRTPHLPALKISQLSYFKGAHGISSVSSISVAKSSFDKIEICTTGADGCICYFEYDAVQQSLEFIGMKQVKELSLVRSVSAIKDSPDEKSNCGYAVGFASTDFIIWNLITETKVVQIPCGGWRRPHCYYLGDVPETKNCFAYVKDEIIYVYQNWVSEREGKIFPLNLHIQFHGREMHSLCFVSESLFLEEDGKHGSVHKTSWIATGCEDGTVRLTGFTPGVNSWFTSKLLGEHVGGSAVRAICYVSKMHTSSLDLMNLHDWRSGLTAYVENPRLLISVGAKRVLTAWLLRDRKLEEKERTQSEEESIVDREYFPSLGDSSSMSFKWLSTDMPVKNSSICSKAKIARKNGEASETVSDMESNAKFTSCLLDSESDSSCHHEDKHEDDWRYLAVTAFLVKCPSSRLIVCFVVVACSDATLALRALVLPHRLWFDVALLVPLSSPVLTVQNIIIPMHLLAGGNRQMGNVYLVVSGATDGSIALWDLTKNVEAFLQRLSALDVGKLINCQTRPRTGRGSQGGRWWRSLSSMYKKTSRASVISKTEDRTNSILVNDNKGRGAKCDTESCTAGYSEALPDNSCEPETYSVSPQISEIQPLNVFTHVHQSGVNCLYVSDIKDSQSSGDTLMFSVISGGDDQALHCLKFLYSTSCHCGRDSVVGLPNSTDIATWESKDNFVHSQQKEMKVPGIKLVYHDRVPSAHGSAVKGIWTDGTWVFSTGLDQRVRCWLLKEHYKLTEKCCLIVCVPEPEALQVRACGRNMYQIVVAGRGMQMIEFSAQESRGMHMKDTSSTGNLYCR
ncbi:hypothetical protein K2173_008844 [Erythroxylum novogranatense]|uniref:WD repeat-containing protein 6 n=1 Tax=Erythroxylum novogranatense TaxID=1862640 RepID=A0AAV8UDZ5_9ROSI|nr:hypothetical protein K2173_008844 [Erythroxylum novogranatense]